MWEKSFSLRFIALCIGTVLKTDTFHQDSLHYELHILLNYVVKVSLHCGLHILWGHGVLQPQAQTPGA